MISEAASSAPGRFVAIVLKAAADHSLAESPNPAAPMASYGSDHDSEEEDFNPAPEIDEDDIVTSNAASHRAVPDEDDDEGDAPATTGDNDEDDEGGGIDAENDEDEDEEDEEDDDDDEEDEDVVVYLQLRCLIVVAVLILSRHGLLNGGRSRSATSSSMLRLKSTKMKRRKTRATMKVLTKSTPTTSSGPPTPN